MFHTSRTATVIPDEKSTLQEVPPDRYRETRCVYEPSRLVINQKRAWRRSLNAQAQYAEAGQLLEDVCERSRHALGEVHLDTIRCVGALAEAPRHGAGSLEKRGNSGDPALALFSPLAGIRTLRRGERTSASAPKPVLEFQEETRQQHLISE